MLEEINVHIGEVKLGREGETLNALLGSCMGIAFLWPDRGIYGLAHCLLSICPDENPPLGGRYVDQAISSLIQMMEIERRKYYQIQAVIAGGGNMTKPDSVNPEKLVGYHNMRAAVETLSKHKINIIYQDTGGLQGRKMMVNCSTGEYFIKSIPREVAA